MIAKKNNTIYAELGHLEEFQSHKCWVKLISFVHAVGYLNCSTIERGFFQPEVMTIATRCLSFWIVDGT